MLDDARHQLEGRHLATRTDTDGSYLLTARLPAEAGAAVEAALRAAVEHGSAETPHGFPARLADALALALALVAETYLAQRDTAGSPSGRYQVVVTADQAALATGEGTCHLSDGTVIASETARRLACDAIIVALVLDEHGDPLRVGRRTRRVPPKLRLALDLRDRQCRFPGCANHVWADAHHITHWAHGGPTDLDNLLLLCHVHHALVHEGGYHVDHDGTFHQPNGAPIPHTAGHADHVHTPGITPHTISHPLGRRPPRPRPHHAPPPRTGLRDRRAGGRRVVSGRTAGPARPTMSRPEASRQGPGRTTWCRVGGWETCARGAGPGHERPGLPPRHRSRHHVHRLRPGS
ncbi:MAG: DUF222 domain-containing protein [Acidimicrobiia bacterium]|nr:DUF222 domain-containing protein [Acidimicrobiia bacterium]